VLEGSQRREFGGDGEEFEFEEGQTTYSASPDEPAVAAPAAEQATATGE
jgi:hypothetical protein